MNEKFMTPFDLVGDPIPDGWGEKGRPPHSPSDENRNKIRLLLAFGDTPLAIAHALRICVKTLRKHYFPELRVAGQAFAAVRANHRWMVYKQAARGNAGALKQLGKLIEAQEIARLGAPAPEKKPPPLGKKEQAVKDAHDVDPDGRWKGLLH